MSSTPSPTQGEQPLLSRSSSSSPDRIFTTFRTPEEHDASNDASCLLTFLRHFFAPWRTLLNAICRCSCCGNARNAGSEGRNTNQDGTSPSFCFSIAALTHYLSACAPFGTPASPPPSPLSSPSSESFYASSLGNRRGYFDRRPRRYVSHGSESPPTPTPTSYATSPGSPPPGHPFHTDIQEHYPHPYYQNRSYEGQDPEPLPPGLRSHFYSGTYTATAGNTRAYPSANTSASNSQTNLSAPGIVAYGHGYDSSTQRMVYQRIADTRGNRAGGGGGSPRNLRRSPLSYGSNTYSSTMSIIPRRTTDRDVVYEADYDGEDLTASSTVQSSDDGGDIDDIHPGMRLSPSAVTGTRRRRQWVWNGSEDDDGEISEPDEAEEMGEFEQATETRPLLMSGGGQRLQPGERRPMGHERQRSYGSSDATPRPQDFLSVASVIGVRSGNETERVPAEVEAGQGQILN